MRRSRLDALETRAKIIDAAERVFLAHGVARASLEEIATRAGVTRGAVYNHFKNKKAVFEALYESAQLPLDPFIIRPCDPPADPLDHLRAELRERLHVALHTRRARRLYAITLTRCEITAQTRAFYERVAEAALAAETQIEAVLRAASLPGDLSSDLDARTAARFIHAALSGFLRKRLTLPLETPPAQQDTEADRTLLTALRCIGETSRHASRRHPPMPSPLQPVANPLPAGDRAGSYRHVNTRRRPG
ncbi:TetR family transcriptional regulator [Burkholderia multivorans]|uniref:TetR family transcriptional regulator n=1 Tax=Burkholderia multivorans TaxID=87883 RepID=UPI001C256C45|nr:TetR family transcriptional regulator [Burkholderia multivorans]MBU9598128.1 TetR family transcriptional regulator [Burkholderia multivorans]